MIVLDEVSKVYAGRRGRQPIVALDAVNLHVERGEVVGVVGESGSGKSTLIRCVNQLEVPSRGAVTVAGRRLDTLSEPGLRAARAGIGMVFQHFNLLDSRTAAGNIALPLQLAGWSRAHQRERAAELLDVVGLTHRAQARPGELSGGQRQRVAIARALATRPQVLLLDEATSALDAETTESVLSLLSRLVAELDLTVLLVTHEPAVVRRLCTRAVALSEGRLVDDRRLAVLAAGDASPLRDILLPALPAAAPVPEGWTSVDIVVGGALGASSVLSGLADRGLEVEVLAGAVETLGGVRAGRLRLALRGSISARQAGQEFLASLGEAA